MGWCCSNCFEDQGVKKIIERLGDQVAGDCDYCDARSPSVLVETGKLKQAFCRVVDEFFMPIQELDTLHPDPLGFGESLHNLLESEFGPVFRSDNSVLLSDILNDGISVHDGDLSYDTSDLWCLKANDFQRRSLEDHWFLVARAAKKYGHSLVLEGGRFLGTAAEKTSYEAVRAELLHLKRMLEPSVNLFRARRGQGHTGEALKAPPPEKARAGRGNLQGQPVLYLAGDRETAIYEIRPSIGDVISLACFHTRAALELCDLTAMEHADTPFVESGDDFAKFVDVVRRNHGRRTMGRILGEPVRAGDEDKDYIATQFLVRTISLLGFDGVVYPSSQRQDPNARNYLLFDPGAAVQVQKEIFEERCIQKIEYVMRTPSEPERAEWRAMEQWKVRQRDEGRGA